jgi:hypothetical protein
VLSWRDIGSVQLSAIQSGGSLSISDTILFVIIHEMVGREGTWVASQLTGLYDWYKADILRLKSRRRPLFGRMIEHVSVPISDYTKSKQFYLEALKPLDYVLGERLPERRSRLFRGRTYQLLDHEKEEAGAADSCRAARPQAKTLCISFIPRRSRPARRIMGCRGFDASMATITTPHVLPHRKPLPDFYPSMFVVASRFWLTAVLSEPVR